MTRHLTTKYGDRCLVLAPAGDHPYALVRRESDGLEIQIYPEDLQRTNQWAAFYGIEDRREVNKRMERILRQMRQSNTWQ